MTKARISNQRIVPLGAAAGFVGTFGRTESDGTLGGYVKTNIGYARVTLPEDGDMTKFAFYTKLSSSGNMKGAIYDASSKLGESSAHAVNTSFGWEEFPITVSLSAGDYWLAWIANQTWWYKFIANSSEMGLREGQVYATFPDGFGYTSLRNEIVSAYGTCE